MLSFVKFQMEFKDTGFYSQESLRLSAGEAFGKGLMAEIRREEGRGGKMKFSPYGEKNGFTRGSRSDDLKRAKPRGWVNEGKLQ